MYDRRRVSVFGGREIIREIYDNTVLLGEKFGNEGYTVFCGGCKSVIGAISKSAKIVNGLVIGILKGQDAREANDYLLISISKGIGIARNAVLVYNCDVALAISGKYSTHSGIVYGFQLNEPVISYETLDINPIIMAKSPDDVVSKLKREFECLKSA